MRFVLFILFIYSVLSVNVVGASEAFKTNTNIQTSLPLALQNGEALPIALALKANGDSLYEQKQYDLAIPQYLMSIEYLTANDISIQRILGRVLVKTAQAYKRLENREKTAEYYRKALGVFTLINDERSIARTLNTLAEAERYLNHLVLALDYAKRSLEIHSRIDDPDGKAKALMGAGIIQRYIGRYEQSLKYMHEARTYYKQINDPTGISKTSNQIGHIYLRLEQFDQARSAYMLTISFPEGVVDSKTLATALRDSAIIDLHKESYLSAYELARKADEIYQKLDDADRQSITQRILGDIDSAQNNYTTALTHYRKSLSLAIKSGSYFYQIKALIPLGALLIQSDIDEALVILNQSLLLAIKIDHKVYQQETYHYLRLAEKERGQLAASLEYAEKEIALRNSIQLEIKNNDYALEKAKLHALRLELELARKNDEIEISQQASVITELELSKNRYASAALTLALAVCTILLLWILRRFIASRKENKQLDYLATRDPLTQCFNRRVLFDVMNSDLARTPLPMDYCIIMIDVDNFKSINDNYGHTKGDSVLLGVAKVLQSCINQQDTATRFGGEEFCIILPDKPPEEAMQIAETMREKIQSSHFGNIAITCSFGITSIQFGAKTSSELIDQADLALFKSKSDGRNTVTLWCETLERD